MEKTFLLFLKKCEIHGESADSHDSADDSDKISLGLDYYNHLVSVIQVSDTMVEFLEMRNTSRIGDSADDSGKIDVALGYNTPLVSVLKVSAKTVQFY